MDAVSRTGRKLTVAFNYRWRPGCTLVRRLLQEGTIGEIVHVDLSYLLDTSHGADYFRRWHREKDKSGGLLVHKGTHHFDLVNWWLDAVPETVFGMGRLAFYGRENAERRGVNVPYDRYTGQDTGADPFAIDLAAAERTRGLYLEAERHDGYRRDQNVFGDGVSIEDTMSLLVRYRTGVVLNYSLNAYMPREGFSVAFNGTRGRLEYQEAHGADDEGGLGGLWSDRLVVLPHFGKPYEVPVHSAEGGHGGADPSLQERMFSARPAAGPVGTERGPRPGRGVDHGRHSGQPLLRDRPARIGLRALPRARRRQTPQRAALRHGAQDEACGIQYGLPLISPARRRTTRRAIACT